MDDSGDVKQLVETVIGHYTREAELYRGLLDLAIEQGARLERCEPLRSYAALFPRKDGLLRAIGALERELEPLKRRWWTEPVGPEARRRLDAILDELLLTIEAIRAQEERNERLLMGMGLAATHALRKAQFVASQRWGDAQAAPCAASSGA